MYGMIRSGSKVEDDTGGEAGVVLGVAKEAGLEVVALKTPGEGGNEVVVEATSDGGS